MGAALRSLRLRSMRALPRSLALAAGLAALAGCLATGPAERAKPIVLFYPYPIEDSLRFDGYEAAAHAAAPAYVRVVINDPTAALGREAGTETKVNAASGVIVSEDGLVVTAAHIALDRRYEAELVTIDGRKHPARILAVEPGRELALLRVVPFPGMRWARLADSTRLGVGTPVFAIGAPDNKAGGVSLGTVTEPRRRQRLEYNGFGFDDAIKLAIEVEPGFSGGPVFDRGGQMVGIVAGFAFADTKNGAVSLRAAYAVPANAIREFLGAAR